MDRNLDGDTIRSQPLEDLVAIPNQSNPLNRFGGSPFFEGSAITVDPLTAATDLSADGSTIISTSASGGNQNVNLPSALSLDGTALDYEQLGGMTRTIRNNGVGGDDLVIRYLSALPSTYTTLITLLGAPSAGEAEAATFACDGQGWFLVGAFVKPA